MTNTKSTKRALLASVMALFLCFTMLLGTTFAWFTDSVSNGVNKIQSGNLDIELYHMNYAEAVAAGSANGMAIPKDEDGFKVVGDTKLFLNEDGKEMLWEPGATSVENFRIVNEGTLALKYQFKITFSNATATPDGKTLADIINISASETKYDETTGHAVGVDGNATLNDRKLGDGHVFEGTLLPGEAYNFWVGLQWLSSDVDDDFNVEGGLSIDLGVTLLATQLSYEKDNYAGDQYDKDATYPELNTVDTWDGTASIDWFLADPTAETFTLSTAEDLAGLAAILDGTAAVPSTVTDALGEDFSFADKEIILESDIDLYREDENGEAICFDPIGSYRNEQVFSGVFDGQGHTISNLMQTTWALDNGYYYSDCGLGLFGAVEEATIKNLVIDGANISGESALCGTVAAVAHNSTFENITVKNANVADYQYYAGGIVGWASGECSFVGCNMDASTNIAAQWGDFDNSIGGVIGGASTSAQILLKDCTVACRIDAYNDVTSSYQWYAYRRAGMLIGNSGSTTTDEEGATVASAPQLTCENVTVIYGDWANYTYCEFAGTSWPYVRVQAGVSNSAYSNPRYGHPTDANGNEVVDDNHVHNDGEDHLIECTFDQLYGGGQGVYGTAIHDGVNVVYNNK